MALRTWGNMFCTQCGNELPDSARYCDKCGASAEIHATAPSKGPPPDAVGTKEASPSATSQHRPMQPAHPQKGATGPYFWLTLALFFLTLVLAMTVFSAGVQSQSSLDYAEKGAKAVRGGLIWVVFLLYGTSRAWKFLLEREPQTYPAFKQKHRRFQIVAGTCVALVSVSALSYGVVVGQRIEKSRRSKALLEEARQQDPRNLEFRQRLGAIRSRETPTMEDYYNKCLALEALLDEFEPQKRKNSLLLNSARTEWGDDEKVAPTLELLERISELDSQFKDGLRKEIAAAKELWSLPPHEQEAFYERMIVPIQAEIDAVAEQQMLLLQEAQQQGITLPAAISGLLDED